MKVGRKRREVVIGAGESEQRKKRETTWKKWAWKQPEERKRGHEKAHVKGQISSAEQREYERQNASENRAKKVNNKENADVNGVEKSEEISWVLFEVLEKGENF